MNESQLIQCALSLPDAEEDYPFGPAARVVKVHKKMFALISHCEWQGTATIARVNLKCEPQEALILRDLFTAVLPGYHMNKTHWNSVMLDGSVPSQEIERMVYRSFRLVVKSLKKEERKAMETRWGEAAIYRK